MAHTTPRQPLPTGLAPDMSGGYLYADGAYQIQPFELINIVPGGSFSASATDMASFMIALLQGGRYGEAGILEGTTVQRMFGRLFAHDERLNGFAYGFYEMDRNGQRIIGHGGDTTFFHSLLALLPEHHVGLFVSYNSAGGSMLSDRLLQAFLDRYYPAPEMEPVQPPADFAARAGRFTGSYRLNHSSHTTAEKVATLLMAITVQVTAGGTLLVNSPLGQQRFVEVEPLFFQEVGGKDILVFRQDAQGNITHAFLNSVPVMAIEKLAWYQDPLFHYVLLAVCMLLFLSVLIVGPIGLFLARRGDERPPRLARLARWFPVGLALFSILFLAGLVAGLSDQVALMTGHAPLLRLLPFVSLLIVALAVATLIFAVLAWKGRYWNVASRVHYTLVALAAPVFVWMLNYWNLLGWRL